MAVCHDGPFLRGCANEKKPDVPMRERLTFMYEYLSCHNFVLAGAGLLLTLSRASRPFPSLSGAFFDLAPSRDVQGRSAYLPNVLSCFNAKN